MAILLPQRVAVTLTHGDVWSCPGSGGEQRNFGAPRSRLRRSSFVVARNAECYTVPEVYWVDGEVSCRLLYDRVFKPHLPRIHPCPSPPTPKHSSKNSKHTSRRSIRAR